MPFVVPSPPSESACTPSPLYSPRGPKLATRIWQPSSGKVSAICLLVHGSGWHSGYFNGLASRLNRDDIFVAAYDQVGHGYSDTETRSTQKGTLHVRRFVHWVHDLLAAAAWTRQQAGGNAGVKVPLFVVGESLGGLQALVAALDPRLQQRYKVHIDGVVTLGAMLQLHSTLVPSPSTISRWRWQSLCCPRRRLDAIDNSSNGMMAAALSFDEKWIGNKDWAATARHDNAVQYRLQPTMSAAVAILQASRAVARQGRRRQLHVPLLAIHATNDPRCDCEAVMQLVDQVGSGSGRAPKAEGMWLENATGHQLLQDHKDVSEAVKNRIAEWIVSQIKTS